MTLNSLLVLVLICNIEIVWSSLSWDIKPTVRTINCQ
jgi:hypothetical protein